MKTTIEPEKLEDIRELIDSVDREIILLLKQRSRLIDMVVEVKKETKQEVNQPTRFALMVDRLQEIAKEEGLDPDLVIEVWDAIHESSKRQQNKVLNK
ncbi:chorismate mutase [Candidatus Nomurabacteria bacterium]|nr:chorismate mutase [Candidatus Nomurabacteria bacterium]